jgi:uncharacterized protein YjbI with pentapeptide repeats
MTVSDFLQSYEDGIRYFSKLDFEYEEGFANQDFTDIVFENCFLYVEFCHSNLTNAKFISCNIKEIDLAGANLTNAIMTKCLVESAVFANAIVDGFSFFENYSFGATLEQEDFEKLLRRQENRL